MRGLTKEEVVDIERIYKEAVKEKMNTSFYLNLYPEKNLVVIVTPKIREENEKCELREFFIHNGDVINVYLAVNKG